MTAVVDVAEVPGNLDNIQKQLGEAVAAASAPAKDEQKQAAPAKPAGDVLDGDDVPVKLRGKTAREIALMYQNLESSHGRMANDLGQQRALTDKLLDLKRAEDLQRNQPEPVKVDRAKLLEDPTAELTRFIEAREAGVSSEAKQRLDRMEISLAQQEFTRKHPDYAQVAAGQDFVDWVQSSALRKRAAQAAYNGDWGAADELMTEFEEQRAKASATSTTEVPASTGKEAEAAKAVEAAKAAQLESGSSGSGNADKGQGRIYRRADLLELKLKKPEVYYEEGFQAEIMRAYRDNRVR